MSDESLPVPTPGRRWSLPARHVRPADACPYPRPFPAGFRACPTFGAAPYAVEDTAHRPLRTVTSCVHLVVREEPGTEGRYYPACGLGAAADRAAAATAGERPG